MKFDYYLTTKQHKDGVLRALSFLSTPSILHLLTYSAPLSVAGRNQTVFINVIGTRRMQSLNKKFRKNKKSTDVLSFELHDEGVLGELYLCPDDISKNARNLGHSFEGELLEIIIHGLLHLCGYEHSDEMFDWQKKVTDRILKEYENTSRIR